MGGVYFSYRAWLDRHDGATANNPGFDLAAFDNIETPE